MGSIRKRDRITAIERLPVAILAANAVEQLAGRHQVGLAAQVVKTADAMLGTLIDLKA